MTASLLDAKSGQYVWPGRFGGDLAAAEIQAMQDGIADQVVHELAQPYGVIFNERASEIDSITSYECVLRFKAGHIEAGLSGRSGGRSGFNRDLF